MHPESISSRISETSYGFPENIAYTEPWTHGGPGPETNPVTGELEMKDRMNWVIKKVRGDLTWETSFCDIRKGPKFEKWTATGI